MRANLTLNHECVAAYEELVANGVDAPVTEAPITALFRGSAEAEHLLEQLQRLPRRRTAELHHGIDRCGVARAGAAGLERSSRRRPHQRSAVRQSRRPIRTGAGGAQSSNVAGHSRPSMSPTCGPPGRASRCSPAQVLR